MNSHWVAEQTVAALQREHDGAVLTIVAGDDVNALRVAGELAEQHDGFAYFGHGREHVLYRERDDAGAPVPLVGVEHVHLFGDRWFHAFACLSGHTLCQDAAKAGAAAYLGYRVTVNVSWDVPPLPGALRALLQELVTVATLQLAKGERSRGGIRRRVREVSDRLLDWMDMHVDECSSIHWGDLAALQVLASLLHQKLELEGAAVLP